MFDRKDEIEDGKREGVREIAFVLLTIRNSVRQVGQEGEIFNPSLLTEKSLCVVDEPNFKQQQHIFFVA